MTRPDESPVAPGSPSVQDLMTGAAQEALRSGVHEMARATGKRGTVTLFVSLTLGEYGEPLSVDESLYFRAKRQTKVGARDDNKQA